MKRIYEESELIITNDHKIYHLHLSPGQLAENIILVGDPGRVPVVSALFDSVDIKVHNREIVTHTGTYKGKAVSVLSTGLGPDNIDIVVNEMDALFNIDFTTRQAKQEHCKLNMVRIGTSGALQDNIQVDSYVASHHGLGIDGVLNFYKQDNENFDPEMAEAFIQQANWPEVLPRPYAVKASKMLLDRIASDMFQGITSTAPGFFGPQGRELRARLAFPDLNEKMSAFNHNGMKISNFEMETSALYGLGALLGHETLTVCLIIANRIAKQFSRNYKEKMEDLIKIVLDRLTGLTQ